MNIKLKAALYTVGTVVGGYIGISLIRAIFEAMPENWRENCFYAICIGLILYGMYSIFLSTLEMNERLKNIADRT